MRTVVTDGVVLDTATMSMVGERDVVIDGAVIVDVSERYAGDTDVEVDASGGFVLPGLIDGHVHFRLATMFGYLNRWNDTMATTLEPEPLGYAADHLSANGWTAGKHAPS